MFERITDLLMLYTALIDSCNEMTVLLLESASKGKMDSVDYLSNNRARLINVISMTQGKIETLIDNLQEPEINKDNLEIIKSWSFDVSNWIQITATYDEKILEVIQEAKDQTSQEIASMFKTKMAFKGYNLKNVNR